MIGCDLHDKTMLLKVAVGREAPQTLNLLNTPEARVKMIADLKQRARQAQAERIVFAYEASGLGFGLYDQLTAAGIECHVLAPTGLPRSVQHRQRKTDERDTEQLLDVVRAHVLAGNELPNVWIPDPQTRDDRDLVRARLEAAEKLASVKTQVKSLLKRNALQRPAGLGKGWTKAYRYWLGQLGGDESDSLASGARVALGSLLRQIGFLEEEVFLLDEAVLALALTDRYHNAFYRLHALKGVGTLTAMVFLTEIGDWSRFANRRQIASYLGLVPSSFESGQANDRKGHITRQGPSRVRKVLCQAVWSRVRTDDATRDAYERVVARNPKHKKVATVACMRRLAIQMWHRALEGPPTSARARQNGAAPPRLSPSHPPSSAQRRADATATAERG
jgi:transposase